MGGPPASRRLSVLDLGSNSFHVLVADVTEDGSITPIAREREMLHLGEVVGRHGAIPDDERGRAVDVVAHLTDLATRLGATERLAVATAALREADNGPAVVAHMEAAAATSIDVIDGIEEARLGLKGLAAAVGAAEGPGERVVLDLGGGSLEIAVGAGDTMQRAVSLPLGVSRLSTMLDDDPPDPDQVARLRDVVRREVAAAATELGLDDVADVRAIGGTVRALARVAAAAQGRWWPATVNLLPLDADAVARLARDLAAMDTERRTDVPGMKTKRADRLHVAAIVVDEAMCALGVDRMRVSDWGLREGVLLEACGVGPIALADLQDREIRRMQAALLGPADVAHLEHVARLAGQLFDATEPLHELGPADRAMLVAGARLHGVGRTLALRKQHHHGAYLIEHYELRGFTPLEAAELCCMARFHKSSKMSRTYAPWAAMGDHDAAVTAQLVALLQVADALDRSRDQAVTRFEVGITPDRLVLLVDGAQLGVAVPEVQRRTAWFEQVFATTVEVRLGSGVAGR